MADLDSLFEKLSPKDGDIIFFDIGSVDTKELAHMCSHPPEGLRGVVFIGVSLRYGQAVGDAVFEMSKDELQLLIAEKS